MIEAPRGEPIEAITERFKDPLYLPETAEVERLFTFDARGGLISDFQCYLMDVFEGSIYNYPTKEYIRGLGTYLGYRIDEIGGTSEKPVTILEVAAGSGRLSHFIGNHFDTAKPGAVKVIATDNFSWPDTRQNYGAPVENIGYDQALEKYSPDIVIGAWLPNEERVPFFGRQTLEMAQEIRRTPSVQEMILIGNPKSHATLDAFGLESNGFFETVPQRIPNYTKEGFIKTNLRFLNPHLFSSFDRAHMMHESQTIAFSKRLPFPATKG